MRALLQSMAALAAAFAAAGCTSLFPPSAPVRYYALTLVPPARAADCAIRFGVRPVALPGYVDRDEIIVGRQGAELVISNADVWAAPLRAELTRTLGESLAQRWAGSRYAPHPWRFGETPPWTVDIAFEQIDAAAGSLAMRARWSVSTTGDARPSGTDPAPAKLVVSRVAPAVPPLAPAELSSGRFEVQIPLAANSAGNTAEAIARAVGQLADRIAEESRPALRAHESACG